MPTEVIRGVNDDRKVINNVKLYLLITYSVSDHYISNDNLMIHTLTTVSTT